MSRIPKCFTPVTGEVSLSADTITQLAAAARQGIELGTAEVGCILDVDKNAVGKVFLVMEKSEDGLTTTNVLKAIDYASGVITSPYLGVIQDCNSANNPNNIVGYESVCVVNALGVCEPKNVMIDFNGNYIDPVTGAIIPPATVKPLLPKQAVKLDDLCVKVDNIAKIVTPFVVIDPIEGTPSSNYYINETGQVITGVVTSALPCDCECIDCTQLPSLRLIKQVVAPTVTPSELGQTIHYGFTVTNDGSIPVNNVMIFDPNANVVGGPIAVLAPGATDTTTFTATHVVTASDVAAGQVVNQSFADGSSANGNVSEPSRPTSVSIVAPTIQPVITRLQLLKTIISPVAPAKSGDTVTYQFALTNTGAVDLTNVTVNDPSVVLIGAPIAVLAVGATSTAITGTRLLTAADTADKVHNNTATGTADSPTGPVVSIPASASIAACADYVTGPWTGTSPATAGQARGGTSNDVVMTSTINGPSGQISTATTVIDPADLPAWFTGINPGAPALEVLYNWDNSPGLALDDIDLPTDDKVNGTITFVFANPVTNPVLHIDRLGGRGQIGTISSTNTTNLNLVTPTSGPLVKLSGTVNLIVSGTNINRQPDDLISVNGAQTGDNTTAGGSILIPGTFNQLVFNISALGVEGGAADAFRLAISGLNCA
jgi:hypothetical protein